MKIFEKERWLREQGIEQGLEQGRRDEAMENARELFKNGVSYELVRASIKLLTDEKLREIYEKVIHTEEK